MTRPVLLYVLFLFRKEKNEKKPTKGALSCVTPDTKAAPFGIPRHAST